GHALAYCQAVEALAGCSVPPRARRLRVVLLELERIYNHVGDVGMIINDTGFSFGHAHCFRIREELLRLNERLTGHRLLRGAVVPGGVTGPIVTASLPEAATTVVKLVAEFVAIARLCLDNTTVLERLQGTGRSAEGATRVPLPPLTAGAHAIGLVEAWRGPIWHWVWADGPASLNRVKVVDPSFRNWPALEYAVLKNIVPDFPLCNKSFNLS